MPRVIQSRADVKELVDLFYTDVRKDTLIGPIFEKMIQREDLWDHHHKKLTDFWESALFKVNVYDGRPGGLHLWVDMQTNRVITQDHFDRWLQLWRQTIRVNFHGEKAEMALEKADLLAVGFFRRMMAVRAERA